MPHVAQGKPVASLKPHGARPSCVWVPMPLCDGLSKAAVVSTPAEVRKTAPPHSLREKGTCGLCCLGRSLCAPEGRLVENNMAMAFQGVLGPVVGYLSLFAGGLGVA